MSQFGCGPGSLASERRRFGFILRGVPAHIRSDNGPEFVAKAAQEWIAAVGAKTAYIERGSPWEKSGHPPAIGEQLGTL